MGVDMEDLEKTEKLQNWDWYTCQLGQKSKEKNARESLKVSDLSPSFSRGEMFRLFGAERGLLQVSENTSAVVRFNDEKVWVKYVLTRVVPATKLNQSILIRGIMKGVPSEWAYKQHEGSMTALQISSLRKKATRDVIRIRTMRDVGFDREWH
jgi:hypothetical protein